MDRVVGEYGDALALVYCDVHEQAAIVGAFGFSGQKDPVYCIARFVGGEVSERYAFPERALASPENIVRFVGQFLNMTAAAAIKSEEPVGEEVGPVYKLVGRQFSDVVREPKTDVVTALLVGSDEERNATLATVNQSCGELRRQKVKTVACYYIDLELNATPGLKTGNWTAPVVLLWAAGDEKVPLLFEGNVSVNGLLGGIRTNGKTKLRFKVPKQKSTPPPEL
jgi:hypothetical protein